MRIISLVSALALAGALFAHSARAEASDIQFDIEAQPASAALQDFAEQSGLQLAYLANITENLRTRGVSGSYEPTEALRLLLDKTGLEYRRVDNKTIAVLTIGDNDLGSGVRFDNHTRLASAQAGSAVKLAQLQEGAPGTQGTQVAQARDGAFVIEEIIVTARKRAERLQDTSLAISAYSAKRLTDSGIHDVQDLQILVPSLTVSDAFGIANINMRGLGNTSVFSNEDPSVIVNVDGAVISRPEVQTTSFFDLERIEVVRGPQGTLYGRNATGGAINLITAKPTEEFEAYARVTAGRFERVDTEGAISGPLTDKILGRFAWKTRRHNGFGENEFTGSDIDNRDRISFRASFAFDVSDDIDFLLTGEYFKQDDTGNVPKFRREAFPGTTNPALVALGIGGFSDNPRNFNSEWNPTEDKETWSVTGILDWQLSDRFAAKSVINYREYDRVAQTDLDASSVRNGPLENGQPTTDNRADSAGEQFSLDLQLHHEGDVLGRRLVGVMGFYYFNEDNSAFIQIGKGPKVGVGGGEPRVKLFGVADTEVVAGYWSVNYDLIPQRPQLVVFKAGGRFTHEDREIDNRGVIRVANGLGPTIVIENPASDSARKFNEYTNEVGVDFHLYDNILTYFMFSEGFKSGTGLIAQLDSPIIDAEEIDNYEIGIKTEWFDRRLTVNITGFTSFIKGVQFEQTLPADNARGFVQEFRNAAGLSVDGIEAEIFWQPIDHLRLSFSGVYLDAEFSNFVTVDPTDATQSFQQLRGNVPPRSPKWKFNFHGELDFPLVNLGLVTVQTDVTYIDNQFFREFNTPAFAEDEYALVNASATYTAPSERWSAQVWGRNLSSQRRTTFVNFASVARVLSQSLTPPLTWGVTLGYSF